LVVAVARDLDVQVAIGSKPRPPNVQLDVRPARRPFVTDAQKRDLLAWRPGQVHHAAVKARHQLRLSAVDADLPDGGDLLEAGVLAAVGEEGDLLAIGRPFGTG